MSLKERIHKDNAIYSFAATNIRFFMCRVVNLRVSLMLLR